MNISRVISRIVFYFRRHRYGEVSLRIAACAILTTILSLPQLATATTVRMETTLGTIDIELYDDQAPKTVANFLRYAGRGDYSTNGIIHRSVPGFVIQGGGYAYIDAFGQPYYFHIPEDPPVQNEFSPSRSNVRGTIAMAKLGGNPDSATSEWFFNLADNSANLDTQNGGFTVFGRVLDPGMNVVDAMASLPVWNASATFPAFNQIPLVNYDPAAGVGMQPSNLVMVTRIPNVASTLTLEGGRSIFTTDVDMTFGTVGIVDSTITIPLLAIFTPPPHTTVQFKDGIYVLTVTGTMGPTGRIVTLLRDAAAVRPTHYYAYGSTPDNTTDHWYDFSFDGETGAEIVGDKIILHFVDGKRGDSDLTVNSSISHIGAPVLVEPIADSTKPAGCTIAAMPSQTTSNGDWILISMFLSFVALVRRRARSDRI